MPSPELNQKPGPGGLHLWRASLAMSGVPAGHKTIEGTVSAYTFVAQY